MHTLNTHQKLNPKAECRPSACSALHATNTKLSTAERKVSEVAHSMCHSSTHKVHAQCALETQQIRPNV